jgi:hypothetical protein
MALYVDAMREFWREWVVNYDFSHQSTLAMNVSRKGRTMAEELKAWWDLKTARWTATLRTVTHDAQRRPQRWIGWTIGITVLIAFLIFLPSLLRDLAELRAARKPSRAPQSAATVWYGRMLRSVARQGYTKAPAQTPDEFVSSIEAPPLRASVERFTRSYERARFGSSVEDAEKLPELYEEVASRKS